jgi:hypothetical protein
MMLGAFCGVDWGSGANQPKSGYEFAIICLAASPYDRQGKGGSCTDAKHDQETKDARSSFAERRLFPGERIIFEDDGRANRRWLV